VLGEHTLVMGVLNVTPDSFSDAESFLTRSAHEHALAMECAGADLLDVGGESTRRVLPHLAQEELARVWPVCRRCEGG